MEISQEQLAELQKLKTDFESVHKEIEEINYKAEKMLVKERVLVSDLEMLQKQTRRLADFYYALEERVRAIMEVVSSDTVG